MKADHRFIACAAALSLMACGGDNGNGDGVVVPSAPSGTIQAGAGAGSCGDMTLSATLGHEPP